MFKYEFYHILLMKGNMVVQMRTVVVRNGDVYCYEDGKKVISYSGEYFDVIAKMLQDSFPGVKVAGMQGTKQGTLKITLEIPSDYLFYVGE